jgi:polyhydroxyalkanoate synthesis regulator phasin
MPEEKRPVGRPRKYETRSERQKAYHERKKQKMKELEEEVKKLEKQTLLASDSLADVFDEGIFKEVFTFSWKKITPSEIALMGTQELEGLVEEFREKIQEYASFERTLENIVMGIVNKNYLATREEPNMKKIKEVTSQIQENIGNLEERMQQQALLYLMEAELANRSRLDARKSKLDLFEAKIDDLESKGKKELKIEEKQRAK